MAVKSYKKGNSTQLSTNFNSSEFDCHGSGCCSLTLIDEKLVNYLQKIRDHFGKPVNVSSAYRCSSHNKSVGGVTGSRHTKGEAADIYINGVAPAEIAKYAESLGILGIGLYETNADGFFVHVDTRTSKSFWYGQSEKYCSTFGGTAIKEEEKKIDTSKVNDKIADPKVIWDYFKEQGLNDYGIAGLMGNLYAESGLKPTNLQNTYEKKFGYTDAEYTAAVDQKIYTNFVNDSAGYGLAQWTYYSRKQNMLDFHNKKGKSIGDLTTQLDFLTYELSNNYKAVWQTLKTATSLLEASNAVLLKFERPADQSSTVQNKRASYGQKYYDDYHTETNLKPAIPEKGANEMKYSKSNPPLVCMQKNSTCYKGTREMTVKGVLWHSTGADNPTLKRYVQPGDNDANRAEMLKLLGKNSNGNDWNHISVQAGLNAWIGELANGDIASIQTMPWDYRPWGCGSGNNGSCNNGWIQFEICEDGLSDKTYFNAVYKEACELTAYLCKLYDLNPKGKAKYGSLDVPVILCHADSYKLGLGSNHGDILHWFKKHNKTMDDVRNDVAELMAGSSASVTPTPSTPKEEEKTEKQTLYRVRKTWSDAASQKGAFKNLNSAKELADKNPGYYVFDESGKAIYPETKVETNTSTFKVKDAVKIKTNSTYIDGKSIPQWVIDSIVYVRDVRSNGDVVFSINPTGNATGVISPKNLILYAKAEDMKDEMQIGSVVSLMNGAKYIDGSTPQSWVFKSKLYVREIRSNGDVIVSTQKTGAITGVVNKNYLVLGEPKPKIRITASVLNVRESASTSSSVVAQVKRGNVYTVYETNGKWGRIDKGWVYLPYTEKV